MDVEKARTLYQRGLARWPDLHLSFDRFQSQMALPLRTLEGMADAEICAEDLYIVAACLQRLSGAIVHFDAEFWPALERALHRKEPDAQRLAEMRQALLVRLFVPGLAGEAPRIAEYTGRGPLAAWLRMAARRLLLNTRRGEARAIGLMEAFGGEAIVRDVEMSFIRGRYEDDFVAALRAALDGLSEEERLLLQFRYREELTSNQIALLLKTSRVTAHRRVVAARESLASRIREGLRSRLELSKSGLEELMGLWSSSLVQALTVELKQGLAHDHAAAARLQN